MTLGLKTLKYGFESHSTPLSAIVITTMILVCNTNRTREPFAYWSGVESLFLDEAPAEFQHSQTGRSNQLAL